VNKILKICSLLKTFLERYAKCVNNQFRYKYFYTTEFKGTGGDGLEPVMLLVISLSWGDIKAWWSRT